MPRDYDTFETCNSYDHPCISFLVGDNSMAFTEEASYESRYFIFCECCWGLPLLENIMLCFPYYAWISILCLICVLNAHVLEHFYRIMIGVIISYSCIVAVIFFVFVMHMDTSEIILLHPHRQCIQIHFPTCFSANKRAVLALAGKSQKI